MGCTNIEEAFKEIIESDIPTSLERFGKELDAQWIEAALQAAGAATIRRRKLPAILVVWLVIGMALFRDRSIREVVSHLGLVLPSQKKKGNVVGNSLSPGAIPPARNRVGTLPLILIFEHIARTWSDAAADEQRWRGLALYGIDGTTLRIPDTDENREAFGLPGTGRGQAGYPQVRLVALMALRSHLISAVSFGAYSGKKSGEQSLACELWPKVPLYSLVIMDRGFIDYGLFFRLSHDVDGRVTGDKHWLVRGKKNLKWKTLKVLGQGDELVELSISSAARKKDPSLPKTMVARVIHYQISGHKPQFLITSLIDATAYPAKEVVGLYHERWEIEFFHGTRFAWAVRLWPWTDVFRTNERDNLLIATLSAGVVGAADAINGANFGNIKRVIRPDGVIVKPDIPLLLLDRSIVGSSGGRVTTTYTQHAGGRFTYVYVFSGGASVTPSELGYTGDVYVYNIYNDSGQELDASQSFSTSGSTAYHMVAPIGPSGIAFLGDKDRFVPLGKKRISAFTDDGTISVSVEYASGEGAVTLQGYAPAAPTVTATSGTVGSVDYNSSTHRFTVPVTAAGTAATITIQP